MNRTIEAVVFDWAGTTVDYGCFAPVDAFIKAFEKAGLNPTLEETRAPMGLPKREHVARMLAGDRLRRIFTEQNSREPSEKDIDEIYAYFEPALMETLHNYTDLLPGALDTMAWLKARGIPVGSTTGYTAAMMEVVVPLARQNGYMPDSIVCPDEAGGKGRPFPYMLWRNLERLGVQDVRRVIKVGDTVADVQEGKHAGCISVGVVLGSSTLGLSTEEVADMNSSVLKEKMQSTADAYLRAGADYVISSIEDLPALIEKLEEEPHR